MEKTNEEQGLSIVNTLLNRPSKETVALIKEAINTEQSVPAYVGVVLKKFAKVAELVKKDKLLQTIIEEDTISHRDGDSKTFSIYGAKITVANTGFWDFSQTDDEYYQKLKDIEKEIKVLVKNREEEIKLKVASWEAKNSPKNIVDFGLKPFIVSWDELPELKWNEGYGETNTNPPTKRSKETLRYTL